MHYFIFMSPHIKEMQDISPSHIHKCDILYFYLLNSAHLTNDEVNFPLLMVII